MSENTHEGVAETPLELEALEERREKRSLKTWLVKAVSTTVLFIFTVSVISLIYAAVVKEKDLDTSFIGSVLKTMFEFLHFLLA
jgi:hypothetical protein